MSMSIVTPECSARLDRLVTLGAELHEIGRLGLAEDLRLAIALCRTTVGLEESVRTFDPADTKSGLRNGEAGIACTDAILAFCGIETPGEPPCS